MHRILYSHPQIKVPSEYHLIAIKIEKYKIVYKKISHVGLV